MQIEGYGDVTDAERDAILEEAAQKAQAGARLYDQRGDARSRKAAEVCASNIRSMKSTRVGGTAKP